MYRLLALLIAAAPFLHAAPAAPLPTRFFSPADQWVFSAASMDVQRLGLAATRRRLLHSGHVRSTAVGRDGKTLEIAFRDGARAAILPRTLSRVRVRMPHLAPLMDETAPAGDMRAAVLEPFWGELALQSPEGTGEAQALRKAGFQVTEKSDGAVDVAEMASLSQYNFVYMLTHSGTLGNGDGIIATGQVATPDPHVQPFYEDHSVIVTGVAGTTVAYFGVVAKFFALHAPAFSPNTVLFVNGCSLLHAPLLWQTLHDKGVAAFVSWDADVVSSEQTRAANEMLGDMNAGQSVGQAIKSVIDNGHGSTDSSGQLATIGYFGDGDLTMHDVLYPPPPTPTLIPTATLLPSPTASPTARPTATAIPTPTPTRVPQPVKFWPQVPTLKGGALRWRLSH